MKIGIHTKDLNRFRLSLASLSYGEAGRNDKEETNAQSWEVYNT